jgi:hypothetical protein
LTCGRRIVPRRDDHDLSPYIHSGKRSSPSRVRSAAPAGALLTAPGRFEHCSAQGGKIVVDCRFEFGNGAGEYRGALQFVAFGLLGEVRK